MTQEEKLQLAKEWYNNPSTTEEVKVHLEELFPELRESEDGRMIKSLKRLIKAYYNVNFPTPEGFEREDMLAWIEKQGELPHWKKSILPNDTVTGFNSDYFSYNGYYINYKELFNKLPKDNFNFEKQGEQSKQHLYDIIIALWDLLDKIDTFSDLQIDDTNSDNPFRKIEHITQERHKFVKSDGYNLYIKGEQITDFKQIEQEYPLTPDERIKSAWSEEDERICQCLIKDQNEALDKVKNSKYGHSEIISDLKEMYRERINWLESIKRKMKGE